MNHFLTINPNLKRFIYFTPVLAFYLYSFIITFSLTTFYFNQTNYFSIYRFFFLFLHFISLGISLYFYNLTTQTNPGFVDKDWQNIDFAELFSEINSNPNDSVFLPSEIKKSYCKICENDRPLRAHHCKTCNKCVLKMYHHCFWTNNCVGHGNHKVYYLFIFYNMIHNFFNFLLFAYTLINTKINFSSIFDSEENFDVLRFVIYPIFFGLSIILSFGVFCVLLFLFLRETIYLFNNFTTIESRIYSNFKDSPFYYKKYLTNFKNAMGANWQEWFSADFEITIYNQGYFFINPGKMILNKVDGEKDSLNHFDSADNSKSGIYENKSDRKNSKDRGYLELSEEY